MSYIHFRTLGILTKGEIRSEVNHEYIFSINFSSLKDYIMDVLIKEIAAQLKLIQETSCDKANCMCN
jgi:hypothetical protein